MAQWLGPVVRHYKCDPMMAPGTRVGYTGTWGNSVIFMNFYNIITLAGINRLTYLLRGGFVRGQIYLIDLADQANSVILM